MTSVIPQHLRVPALGTAILHVLFLLGLHQAGRMGTREPSPAPIEIEIVQPPRPKKVARAKPPPIAPAPKLVEPEKPKAKPKPTRKLRKAATKQPPPVAAPPPPVAPAPGANTNDDEPAPVYTMPQLTLPGSVAVATGTRTRGPSGTGGTGTNTGGGGPPDSRSQGRPVSIASIKTHARPIDAADFIKEKDYPARARQLGIEGTIKVRLVVDESGKVTNRRLLNKLGYGLDKVAIGYSQKMRFKPAINTDDEPVASVVVWAFHFRLPP